MNVLAIGAHGDDIEEFCGGTLARHARQGDNVVMCVVTDGRGNPQGDPDEIARIRKVEAQASADLIGAQLVWLAIPDGGLVANSDTRHLFIETIRAVDPDYIITHPPQDYHPDHVATSQLVMQAAQVAGTFNYPSQCAAVRRSVPVAFMAAECGIDFTPEDYVDVTEVWDVKVRMLLQHRSQLMPGSKYDPHYAPPENAHDLGMVREAWVMSEFYGLACGARYAEAFRWWRVAGRIVPRRLLP